MNPSQPIMIDIAKLPRLMCTCGETLFRQEFQIARVSALQSPSGKDEYIPIPVTKCSNCGHIISDYKSLSSDQDKNETEEVTTPGQIILSKG